MDNNTIYRRLGISEAQLIEFCQNARITELALFGSVLREDFRRDSDIDVLVTFDPHLNLSLLSFVQLEYDLQDLLDRDVDLLEKQTVEADRNWIRRHEILSNCRTIYESRPVVPA